ncbi:MAG: hypothetical protein IKP73_20240 [Bacteroidales bacterium]|nr:hypothetical protein [Bacteroidales bacterium]
MKKFKFFVFVAALMTAVACSEPLNEVAEEEDSNTSEVATIATTKSHWGNKIEDPYSVSNMRLAYKELMKNSGSTLSKAGVVEEDIAPTHLHLKFIPKNEEEWRILKKDTILDVVPIPFDYDLEGFDGNYRDPECPKGQPTYQYTVVRIGYTLPDVEYIVLDSLFMPFEDDFEPTSISKSTKFRPVWEQLEVESLKLTGNWEDGDEDFSLSKKKRVTPDGYVKMVDFSAGEIEKTVPNVRVYMNFSTHRSSTYTNASGYFEMPNSFRSRVHTHVYFENTDYYACDKDGDVIAYYRGRVKMEKNEIMTMNKKNEDNYAATIMCAGYDYYHNNKSTKYPPKGERIRIGLQTHNNGYAIYYTTEFGGHYVKDGRDRIFIVESAWCKDQSKVKGEITSDEDIFGKNMEIYATTIYGLAYVSLKNFVKVFSTADPSLLNESYAACVAYVFAEAIYGDEYNPSDFRNNYTKCNSGFFIDMIDGKDSDNEDFVEDYKLAQIENLIAKNKVTNFHDVAERMPKLYANNTAGYLKKLASYWISWSKGAYKDK